MFSYSEKAVKADAPSKIEITAGQGETDIYSWNLDKVGIEITEGIRGYKTEERLKEYFRYFETSLEGNPGMVTINSEYKGGTRDIMEFVDMKVYIPKKVISLSINQETGRIRILDDLECDLDIGGGSLDVEINSIEGRMSCKVDSGSLRVSEGRLKSGTNISAGRGNIRIKADLEPMGSYCVETGSGVIEMNLPEDLDVIFTTPGQPDVSPEAGEKPAWVLVGCGKGEIRISRYKT